MKKYKFLFGLLLLFLVSCKEEYSATEKEEEKVNLISTYQLSSGKIFIYKIGNDTIYVAEGRSNQYPISIVVK
jgi:hypothetical protein